MIRRFTTSRSAVLIISYETFRIHQRHFKKGAQVMGSLGAKSMAGRPKWRAASSFVRQPAPVPIHVLVSAVS